MNKFNKIVSTITLLSFYYASVPIKNARANLPPLNLSQMYDKAARGEVYTLRAAVQRGMNIDTIDRNGNTGLCHAIRRNNKVAYNAFRSAGANPRHSCTQNIPSDQYQAFMDSSGVVAETSSPRAAYSYFNRGEYVLSDALWAAAGWVLLIGAVGGGIALAAGGGGGSSKNKNPNKNVESDSLSEHVGTYRPNSTNNNYEMIVIKGDTNTVDTTISNDEKIVIKADDGSSNLEDLVDSLKFGENILQYAKYIRVGMKASENQIVTNDAEITLKEATAGMVATGENSKAFNNNTIQIQSKNGTIGMIAGKGGEATNNNNINISFSGSDKDHQVIAMYADTKGTITNKLNINTVSSNNASAGTIVGMAGRLTNQEKNPSITNPTKVINDTTGKIKLTSTGNSGSSITSNMIGMGSFLDKDYIDGKKLINKSGFIEIENNGEVSIQMNLSNSSTYDSNVKNGDAGLIGILADANTKATNSGKIEVVANSADSAANFQNAQAGMLSTHGGEITNNGEIKIAGGTGGYGMISVRGKGSNSEFDNTRANITNNNKIEVDSLDGYGIASYNAGKIKNGASGKINIISKGIGIYANGGKIDNLGEINLNDGGQGISIKTDSSAIGGTNYNINNTIVNNNNKINILNASNETAGIFAEAGTINNNGNISLKNSSATNNNSKSYGIHMTGGTAANTINNDGVIDIDIVNADATTESFGIWSEKVTINNKSNGIIKLKNKGTGIYGKSSLVNNHGKVTLENGGIGIETISGHINNNGTVTLSGTEKGIGIKTDSGKIINHKDVIINSNDSVGIESNNSVTNEAGATIHVTGKDTKAVHLKENGTIENNGTIKVTGGNNLVGKKHYGIYSETSGNSKIINNGDIILSGDDFSNSVNQAYAIYSQKGSIENKGDITVDGFYGFGIKTDAGIATNSGAIILNNGGQGMVGGIGSAITNVDDITINGSATSDISYGMKSEGSTSVNKGTLEINADNSFGIHMENGSADNQNIINMNNIGATGIFAKTGAIATNVEGAKINLIKENSTAIKLESAKGHNNGIITAKKENSYGIHATSSEATNTGSINMEGDDSYGIYGETSSITNKENAEINMQGETSYGIYAKGSAGTGANKKVATNKGKIIINKSNSYGMYGIGGSEIVNHKNGTIDLKDISSYGMYASGDNTKATNQGNIKAIGAQSYGMYAINKGQIINAKNSKIDLSNSATESSFGMYADKSTATNDGEIILGGDKSTGIYGKNTSTIENTYDGKISLSGTESFGMYADSSDATNDGEISNFYSKEDGTIVYLNEFANKMYGIYGAGTSTITNKKDGLINIYGTNSYGIYSDAGTISNSGEINIGSSDYSSIGIYTKSGSATNEEDGIINMEKAKCGMATETGNIINKGKILSSEGGIAMYVKGAGQAINDGQINSNGSSVMRSDGGALINNGTIIGTLKLANGMLADGTTASAINNGTITLQNGGYGIKVLNGAVAVNNGTINIEKGTETLGYGMRAENGSKIENALGATINVDAGMTGMYATGAGSSVVNKGTIIVGGTTLAPGTVCTTPPGCGNFIVINSGATMTTMGLVMSSYSLNFNSFSEDGTGRTYLGKGGSFDAPEISGDVYADASIVEEGFEKTYKNENSFVGEDSGIVLHSGSHMFETKLVENEDGGQDVVMDMKDFDDIVENEEVADFLDGNYSAENNEFMFSVLKSAQNQNDFSAAVNNSLGLNFFPSFAKQNLEVIKSTNRQLNNSLFNNNDKREISGMFGYDFYNKNQETSGKIAGYEENAHSVYAIVQKRHNENLSYGGGITVTQLNSKYKNGSKRDESLFQILAPVTYNFDESMKFVSTARLGYGFGEYERYAGSDTFYKADTNNYYYGITNELRKEFDLGMFSLEPSAEFNVIGVYQDKTKEKQQITVKSSNSVSVEAGLGLYAKKSFEIDSDNKISFKFGGSYYQELNNSYDKVSTNIHGMSGVYHINGYKADRYRGYALGRIDYDYKSFNIYGETNKYIERDGAYEFKAGVEIKF